MLTLFLRWMAILVSAVVGLVVVFIAWWLLVVGAVALGITLWIRKLLGKPPLFHAVFRRDGGYQPNSPSEEGGGVEPPEKGAVVIEGEYVVEEKTTRITLPKNDQR